MNIKDKLIKKINENKCIQCGYCCEHMHLDYPNDPIQKEFAQARGEIIAESDTHFVVKIKTKCPHLVESGCDLHGKCKPEGCKKYPQYDLMESEYAKKGINAIDTLGPDCGYRK